MYSFTLGIYGTHAKIPPSIGNVCRTAYAQRMHMLVYAVLATVTSIENIYASSRRASTHITCIYIMRNVSRFCAIVEPRLREVKCLCVCL